MSLHIESDVYECDMSVWEAQHTIFLFLLCGQTELLYRFVLGQDRSFLLTFRTNEKDAKKNNCGLACLYESEEGRESKFTNLKFLSS